MIRKRTIFLRALCLLMALLLTVLLSACGSKDEQTAEPGPTQVPAGIPQATPVPTAAPTATPFPRVDPADYVLIWKNNTRIQNRPSATSATIRIAINPSNRYCTGVILRSFSSGSSLFHDSSQLPCSRSCW